MMKKKLLFLLLFFPGILFSQHLCKDDSTGLMIPVPDQNFISCRIAIYLRKTKIWTEVYIRGNELSQSAYLLITGQGNGTIVLFEEISVLNSNGVIVKMPNKEFWMNSAAGFEPHFPARPTIGGNK